MPRIVIITGEPSGDSLAASIVKQLQLLCPDIEVEGVIGAKSLALGVKPLQMNDVLNVMGFWEPIKRLGKILKLRSWLIKYLQADPPDLVLTIDAPSFNLRLGKTLRIAGMTVIHCCSPTRAWHNSRMHTIRQAVDLILVLFPFEVPIYKAAKIPVHFIGHPLADEIPAEYSTSEAKSSLSLSNKKTDIVIGIFAGSRIAEIQHTLEAYLQAVALLIAQLPQFNFHVLISVLKTEHAEIADATRRRILPVAPVQVYINDSHLIMRAMDIGVATSGTVTLEIALHNKPFVIGYKTSFFNYWLLRSLIFIKNISIKYIGLPNIIADQPVVSEFIQGNLRPKDISAALQELLINDDLRAKQLAGLSSIRGSLGTQAGKAAAEEIMKFVTH